MTLAALTDGLQGVQFYDAEAAQKPVGERIHVFINGIFNDETDAMRNAIALRAMRRIRPSSLLIFHVPDSMEGVELDKDQSLLSALFGGAQAFLGNVTNVDALAAMIQQLASQKQLVLHAHSRGALALEKALQKVDLQLLKPNLHLRTYGGLCVLNPDLGATVKNYINTHDAIIFGGRLLMGSTPTAQLTTWLAYSEHCSDMGRIRQQFEALCSPIDEFAKLASTLRVRCWKEEPHGFGAYLNHLNPTESERSLEKKLLAAVQGTHDQNCGGGSRSRRASGRHRRCQSREKSHTH